ILIVGVLMLTWPVQLAEALKFNFGTAGTAATSVGLFRTLGRGTSLPMNISKASAWMSLNRKEGRMAAWCSFGTATVATIKDSTLTPDLVLSPETWVRYTIQGCQPAENAWMQIRRRLARKAQRFRSGTVPLMTINYGLPTPLTSQTDASTLSIAVGYLLNDNTATIYRRSV